MKSGRILYLILLLFLPLFAIEIYFPKAKVSYDFYKQKKIYYSNDLTINTAAGIPPEITFYKYDVRGKNFELSNVKYINNTKEIELPLPKIYGKILPLDSIKVVKSRYINGLNSFFVEIKDLYSNKDNNKIDSVTISFENNKDYEKMIFYEIAKDSGIFRGYINLSNIRAVKQDGIFYPILGGNIKVSIDDRYVTYIKASSFLQSLSSYADTKVWMEDKTSQKEISDGDFLENKIVVKNNSNSSIKGVFYISLDPALKIVKNSIKIDGKTIYYLKNGESYSFDLKIDANEQKSISFISRAGILKNKNIVNIVRYKNNTLELKTKVVDEFYKDSSIIVGKVSFGTKGVGGVKLYLENGISTVTDKNGKFHFEGIKPDFHVVKIDTSTIEERFAITSCKDNVLYAHSKTSKFVDTSISHIARANFCLKYTGKKSKRKTKKKSSKSIKMPKYTKNSFTNKDDKILWPPKDFIPAFPSIKFAFMHQSSLKAKVFINSKEVDKLSFDGFEISKEKDYKIEKYRGVPISSGDNKLVIQLLNDKKVVKVLKRNIHFSTSPVRAKIVKDLSNLKADISEPPIIAVKLFDKDGYPARKGLIGKCFVSEPYYFYKDIKSIKSSPLAINNKTNYVVENDGITYIKLQPTSISGSLKLHFDFMEDGEYLTTWLEPVQKDWIIVGFAKGTVGYEKLKKNITPTLKKSVIKNGKVSLFAKGKVSDDVIMTIAYNSAKKIDLEKLENSNLKKSYFVYADDSKQLDEAPSSKKLYLKMEKKNFYLLFGDFKTGLNDSKLSKYDVKTTGVKSEYKGKKFSYSLFVSKSKNIHFKDELLPDGTSGKYYLKNRDIIENSESVSIITRDKDNNEKIISQKILSKDIDYSINYYEGYIYFKEPIFSSDENFNPNYIVVDYEKNSDDLKNLTYGGNAKYKLNKKISLSSTYVKSNRGLKVSELKGIDVMLKLYKDVDIKFEGAKSSEDNKMGKAHSEEIKYHHKNISVKASSSYMEKDFGVDNQENVRDKDKKVVTLEASYDLTKKDRFTLRKRYFQTISTGDKDKKEEFSYRRNGNSYMFESGVRKISKDDKSDKKALVTLRKNFFNSKLVTQISKTKSLSKKEQIEADETIFNVNYLLSSKVKLFMQERISELKDKKSKLLKGGVNVSPWKGALVNTSLTKEENSDSFSTFANYGILQDIPYSKNLSFRVGYDAKQDLKGKNSVADYKSYSVGMRYKTGKWHYNAKSEYKDSDEDKLDGSISVYSPLHRYLTIAAALKGEKVFSLKNPSYEIDSRFTMAYRPKKGDFILLNRSDYKYKKSENERSEKFINNLFFDKRYKNNFTIGGQLGLKYVKTKYDEKLYDDLVGLIGLNFIQDINKKFQINSQVSMTFSLGNKTYEYSAGSALGYSPFRDSLVYLGYNVKGFNDEDFESEIYRQEGPYVNFLLKFDEFSLNERAKRSIE